MITAGIDMGTKFIKAVIMIDGELLAYSNMRTGSDSTSDITKHIPVCEMMW